MNQMSPLLKWGVGFIVVMVALIGSSIFFAPAQRDARQTYSIIKEQRGPMQVTLYVESSPGASVEKLTEWAKELEQEKRNGLRYVMINFYNGGRGAENMVATYSDGSLTNIR